MVKLLIHGKFTPEQAHYFCLHALPRSTSAALRLRLPHGLAQRLAGYLHFVLEAAAALLRRPDHWQVAEVVRVILTDAQAYHFYATSAAAPPPRHGAAASSSSGGSSGVSAGGSGVSGGGGSGGTAAASAASAAAREEGAPAEAEGGEEGESSGDSGSEGSFSNDERADEDRACDWFSPSEDVSEQYIRNVELFHSLNGFDTLIARIALPPLLNLTAVQMLLRPLIRVKEVLKKAVLQAYVRRVEQALTAYVQALSDESLKARARRSALVARRGAERAPLRHRRRRTGRPSPTSTRASTPSSTTRASPTARRSSTGRRPHGRPVTRPGRVAYLGALLLDRLRLALALKCLRTPNLEKRLQGLSEVKDMIQLSLRKQEYLDSVERIERANAERERRPHRSGGTGVLLQMGHSSPELLVEWIEREGVVELIFGEALHEELVRRCVEVLGFLAQRGHMDSRLLGLVWRASLDKHETVKQAVYGALADLSAHLPLPLLDELYAYIQSIPFAEYTAHTLTLLRGFAVGGISSAHNPLKEERRWYGLAELWQLMADAAPVSAELRSAAASVLADLLAWPNCAPQRQPMLGQCIAQLSAGSSVVQTLRLLRAILSSFPCKPRKKTDSAAAVLEWLVQHHNLLQVFFNEFLTYHRAATGRLEALTAEGSAADAAAAASRATAAKGGGRAAGSSTARAAALLAARAEHMDQLEQRVEFLNFCMVQGPQIALTQAQLDVLWNRCVVCGSCVGERDLIFRWVEQVRTNSVSAIEPEATRYLFRRASELSAESLSPTAYACIEYLFRWINWREQRFAQQDQSNISVLDVPLHGVQTLWAAALRTRDEAVGVRAIRFLVLLHHSLQIEASRVRQQQREFVSSCMSSLDEAASRLRALQLAAPPAGQPARDAEAAALVREPLQLCVERCLTMLRLFVTELEKRAPLTPGGSLSRRHGACVRGSPMTVQVMLVGGASGLRPSLRMHSNQTVDELRRRVWQELRDAALGGEAPPPQPSSLRMISSGRELKEDWKSLGELKLREPYQVHVMLRPQLLPRAELTTVVGEEDAPAASGDGIVEMEAEERGGDAGEGATQVAGEAAAWPEEGSITLHEVGSNFDTLFALLSLQEERLAARAWQLMMMLPTNREMRTGLERLPALPPGQEPEWPVLLPEGGSAFKLLYSLQIVDTLMQDGDDAWLGAFAARGGLRHLLRLLTAPAEELLGQHRGSQRKTCLVLLLRVVGQLLLEEATQATPAPAPAVAGAQLQPPHDAATAQSTPAPAPAGARDEPRWTGRRFAPLRDASLAALAAEVALSAHLMGLVRHIALAEAAVCAEASGSVDPPPPPPAAEEDVHIVREALRLLVACSHSPAEGGAAGSAQEPQAARLPADLPSLREWVAAMLLRCRVPEVREEACAALYALARDDFAAEHPSSPPQAGGGGAAPGASAASARVPSPLHALVGEMLSLLPPAGAEASRSEQFFELLRSLVGRCPSCSLPDLPAAALFARLLQLQQSHPVVERRDAPELVDHELVGYLRLMRVLLRAQPHLKRQPVDAGGADGGTHLVVAIFDDLFRLPSVEEARRIGALTPPQCKTPRCRAAALALLAELAEREPANLSLLLEMLLAQQLSRSGHSRVSYMWHYAPAMHEKSRCGYVGLKNLGATCYLNSLVQQLFLIPEFRAAILALQIEPPAPASATDAASDLSAADEPGGGDVLYYLQAMFGYLHESEKRWYDTRDFCGAFRDCENLPLNPSVQMDVDEFLNMLFEKLEAGLGRTSSPKLLQSLFGGSVVNQIIDKAGRRLSERVEPFFVISIEVKNKASVMDGLAQFVEGETLDGDNKYNFEGEYVEATKRCCISRLPPVLILHLKRFEFDFDLMKKMKLYDHCEFPPSIDMAPYTVRYLERQEKLLGEAEGPSPADEEDGDCVYELAGVLVHTGTSDSGHYYSFIRERRAAQPGAHPWLHFNDTLVEPFDSSEIGKNCFGGVEPVVSWDVDTNKPVQRTQVKPHSAYMLFYEKVSAHAQSREGAPEAVPRGEGRDGARDQPMAEAEAGAEAEGGDSEAGATAGAEYVEHARLCSDAALSVAVPEEVAREVWAENMHFLRDRYLVDGLHFEFLLRVVRMAFSSVASGAAPADHDATAAAAAAGAAPLAPLAALNEMHDVGMCALRLGCHFVVETLAHAKDKSLLPEWVRMLQMWLHRSPVACRWFLLQSEAAGWVRSLLLACTVSEMREKFAQLLLHAAAVLRPLELHLYPIAPLLPDTAPPVVVVTTSLSGSLEGTDEEEGEEEEPGMLDAGVRLAAHEDALAGGILTSPPKRARTDSSLPAPAASSSLAAAPQPELPAGLRLLGCLLDLLPEAPHHWRHFSHFFETALAMAQLGPEERGWMLRRRFASHLVDFYLADESPCVGLPAHLDEGRAAPRRARMGDKCTLPQLEHMVALLSLLARAAHRHEPVARTPLSLEGRLLHMAADEYQLLGHGALLRRLLKDGLHVAAICDLCEHLCYESRDATETALHVILSGIDTMDNEQLGPYLTTFCHVVDLADSLAAWRIDWALQRLLHVISNNMRYKQATISCMRALLSLCVLSSRPRRWMLHQRALWVKEWLLSGLSSQVRCTAEHFIKAILAAESQPSAAAAGAAAAGDTAVGAALPPPPAGLAAETGAAADFGLTGDAMATEVVTEMAVEPSGAAPELAVAEGGAGACSPALLSMYEHLVSHVVLRELRELPAAAAAGAQASKHPDDVPPPRLAPYFRLCAWCARRGAVSPSLRVEELQDLYALQDGHRFECDETKREMLSFWHAATRASFACVAPPPLVAPPPQALSAAFHRLLDSFVSLRPNERFLEYNRAFLPSFYGLLREMLDCPGGDDCLRVLVPHRNWEWAIKYVIVDTAEYVQLLQTPDQEPDPFAHTLRSLLRSSAGVNADWRLRTLGVALSSNKLLTNRANVLPLLVICMAGEEEVATACERGATAQLCACLDACGAALYEDARWETLLPIMALLAKCAGWLRHRTSDDARAEARRQTALGAWDVAATRDQVLHVLFLLLRPSLGLPPAQGSRPSPVPPPTLQAASFDVAGLLAAVDDSCAQTITSALLRNRARLAPAGPLQAALNALERASAASAASGRLAELEAVLEAAKLVGPLAGEEGGAPVGPAEEG